MGRPAIDLYARFAAGFAILTSAASCVSSEASPSAPAVQTAAVADTKPAPIAPAGPQDMLLAPPPPEVATFDDATPAMTVAPPFVAANDATDAARAQDCLTAAIYYEARSEPIEGQRAVAQVVLNRVRNPAFPKSVCGVVYEGSARSTGCQFTFTCDGSLARRIEPGAWDRARRVAAMALGGYVDLDVGAATFYHTTAILPYWAPSLTRVATIGAHIFYRLGTAWGNALNFRQSYAGVEPVRGAGDRFAPKTGAEVLVQIGKDQVLIHRGSTAAAEATAMAEQATASPVAILPDVRSQGGVTVHRTRTAAVTPVKPTGLPAAQAATPRPAPAASVSGVRVHRGSDAAAES